MGGPWRRLAPDGAAPCGHPRAPKVARDACNACYQRWKRDQKLYGPPVPPATAADRARDARRIVDSLCVTMSPVTLGYVTAELLARSTVTARLPWGRGS